MYAVHRRAAALCALAGILEAVRRIVSGHGSPLDIVIAACALALAGLGLLGAIEPPPASAILPAFLIAGPVPSGLPGESLG